MLNKQKKEARVVICYTVDQDGEFKVDINISDYDRETIDYLATLIASIPSHQFQLQTINIVKDAFTKDEKVPELETLIASVILKSETLLEGLQRANNEDDKKDNHKDGKGGTDEPCIKPSDML